MPPPPEPADPSRAACLTPSFRDEPFDNRFLYGPLTSGHARELRLVRTAPHGNGRGGSDPLFPRQLAGCVKQDVEIGSGKFGQLHEDSIRAAEPQDSSANRPDVASEFNPPWPGHVWRVAQLLEFAHDNRFQTEGGSGDKFQLH